MEMEKLEESQKHWEERDEDLKDEELDDEKRKARDEERRREEVEQIRREHKRELQSLASEYSSAQSHLQARIVALENELREREERCRGRQSRCEDLGRLQDRLTERDQLIKRLVEERHQLQLHPPPVAGDNNSPGQLDGKSRSGSVTPTMRRKNVESPRVTSMSGGSYDRSIFHSSSSSSTSSSHHPHFSSTLPHPSSSHPQTAPHYSTSSLPHKHTSLGQHSSPSLPRSPRSRSSCIPATPAPTAPLPVCPSSQTGIRYVSPSCHGPHLQSIRGPYLEPRGTEGLKQEWYTKYFSF